VSRSNRGTPVAVTPDVWTAAGFAGLRLARHAEAQGIPRRTISTWLGLRPDDLARAPLPRIPIDRLQRAWVSLYRLVGDPAVGVRAAAGSTIADLDLFGFCVATAPTAGAAVRTAARLAALINDAGTWRVDDACDPVVLTWERGGPSTVGRAISTEAAVASFAVCFRELTSASPLEVQLRHRPVGRGREHRDLLGCPVSFGAECDGLLVARAALDVVPRQANIALWRFLTELADQEVGRLGPGSTRARVERAIAAALDGGSDGERVPSAVQVARAVGMSERTLRRRLIDERITFRALLDQVRRARASELVADRSVSLTEVALAAGFADASAFGHAWRRWFGAAPSAMRAAPASEPRRLRAS
jgi:AraC-like DNA-binding protein